ncbi:MAG: diacylglycerol kinase family protein [Prosthecobacter sp.]|jgi:diacylglycerol kinase (ATP)|nr:diacylglycerol kinase family protein [Prosthecobacter sp.]
MSRFLASLRHASNGIAWALKTQRHLRLHALATIGVLTLGLVENLAAWEWCAVWGCIALVWAAELLNTALEALCDRLIPGQDDSVRRVKDTAAGAVLVCAIVSVVIAAIVFL